MSLHVQCGIEAGKLEDWLLTVTEDLANLHICPPVLEGCHNEKVLQRVGFLFRKENACQLYLFLMLIFALHIGSLCYGTKAGEKIFFN